MAESIEKFNFFESDYDEQHNILDIYLYKIHQRLLHMDVDLSPITCMLLGCHLNYEDPNYDTSIFIILFIKKLIFSIIMVVIYNNSHYS